ncbi:hypothetical protein PROFUN_02163 [Planoprotostelium fungivorum]|uniref:SAC domain-containing protein n=1 Tax=Planoprotostelium fungivorum TaxID=1890364 RepID=A0A2P6NZD5_9EUKA|nr:hypothetical protein PROFUN_02163 [Planoprotostelium fungivorum]
MFVDGDGKDVSFLKADDPLRLKSEGIPATEDEPRGEFVPFPHDYLFQINVYETKTRFLLVGFNCFKDRFRVLQIDRTYATQLRLVEDPSLYTQSELEQLLHMYGEGNKSTGGIKKTCVAFGLIGFVRFLQGYFMVLITGRRKVGEISGHFIYGIEDTTQIYIPSVKPTTSTSNEAFDEVKYRNLFFGLDLKKDFYFSYTYDLTRTLQYSMMNHHTTSGNKYDPKYVWNFYLLKRLRKLSAKNGGSVWLLPIIHGFYSQSAISIYGKTIDLILIARRSRQFAGTRFLKRGINEEGYVANDVESEQIVVYNQSPMFNYSDLLSQSKKTRKNESTSHFSSFVQASLKYLPAKIEPRDAIRISEIPRITVILTRAKVRGSIPLYWSQDNSNLAPKPPVIIQKRDPFYASTILHFSRLFRRYGHKVVVLNIVKQEEKQPRETILGNEWADAIDFLNTLLPEDKQITHIAFDIRRCHKTLKAGMMEEMEKIAQETIAMTGFYHSGKKLYRTVRRESQSGSKPYTTEWVQRVRMNCVDSLDRTNTGQFCIGKAALGHQLYALGITEDVHLDLDSDIVELLIGMYESHGNHLALQYAGSELVNTIKTYRAGNIVTHSRDLLTTVKRYYSNSFTDAEKQHAINLFLGHFVPYHQPMSLWDLESDYHLHHQTNRKEDMLLSNTKWWEAPLQSFDQDISVKSIKVKDVVDAIDRFFAEYYPAEKMTSFDVTLNLPFKWPYVYRIYPPSSTAHSDSYYNDGPPSRQNSNGKLGKKKTSVVPSKKRATQEIAVEETKEEKDRRKVFESYLELSVVTSPPTAPELTFYNVVVDGLPPLRDDTNEEAQAKFYQDYVDELSNIDNPTEAAADFYTDYLLQADTF